MEAQIEKIEDALTEIERKISDRRKHLAPREERIARILAELETLRSGCDLAKKRLSGAHRELEVT